MHMKRHQPVPPTQLPRTTLSAAPQLRSINKGTRSRIKEIASYENRNSKESKDGSCLRWSASLCSWRTRCKYIRYVVGNGGRNVNPPSVTRTHSLAPAPRPPYTRGHNSRNLEEGARMERADAAPRTRRRGRTTERTR